MLRDIAFVWYLLSAIVAILMAVFLPKKPLPLSNEVVDRRFRLIVKDLRDESTEADR